MKQQRHRQGESERRQHRAFALFTVIHCWMHDLDGVVFKKQHLLRILGLEKVIKTTTRLEWLKEDLRDFFPYVQEVMRAGKTNEKGRLNSFNGLWVSRRAFPQGFWSEGLDDEPRLAKLPSDGPRIAVFEMWPESSSPDIARTGPDARLFLGEEGNYDEKLMASYLTLLCQGLISPKAIPSLQPTVDILDALLSRDDLATNMASFAQKLASIRARQARPST